MKKKAVRTSDPEKQCATIHCFNVRRVRRRFCNSCRARRNREANPAARLLANLRSSAKRRGLTCDITIEDWLVWCEKTGFLDLPRGRKKGSRSVGRIDHSLGYTIENIRVEDYMFNSHKQKSNEPDDNCPF